MRIDTLSPEQIALRPHYVQKWKQTGLSTEPADRPRAEAAIIAAYAAASLPPPKIVWCGSPLSQGLTRAIILDKKPMASVGDSAWASVGDSVYGQHDAWWLAFYDYFREACGLSTQTDPLQGLTDLGQSAGWFLPHANICWVSERHNILRLSEHGVLHCPDGPAVAYPDGFEIYAMHGVTGHTLEEAYANHAAQTARALAE